MRGSAASVKYLLCLTVVACAHPPGAELWPRMHDRWVGQAEESPFGTIPYGLAFSGDGNTLRAETLKPPTGDLPPAAKQTFVFDRDAMTFAFEATLGDGGKATGTLALVSADSSGNKLTFCHAEGCERMQVVFESSDPEHLVFVTRIKGTTHTKIVLSPLK
jgi:hypothetical protein